MICFFGAIDTEEAFCRRFWVGWEGDLKFRLRSQRNHQFVEDKNQLIMDRTYHKRFEVLTKWYLF